jgi:hypothetical protein
LSSLESAYGAENRASVPTPHADRLRDLKITVGSDAPEIKEGQEIESATAVCTYQTGELSDDEYTFTCETPVVGRFLNIQAVPGNEILTLCEVEVYAEPGASALACSLPKIFFEAAELPRSSPDRSFVAICLRTNDRPKCPNCCFKN